MAHMVETMAYAGETPWHGLGVRVPGDLSPAQMLRSAGLDWTVEKRQMFINTVSGMSPTDSYALVRSSDESVLSVVSDTWNPVQNHDAFDFFNEFVEAGEMNMHTAGSLKDGRMVWALASINEGFTVFGDDRIEGYLLFSNPHEFGKSIDVRFTPIRVVCNNTLTLSLNQSVKYSVKTSHNQKFVPTDVKRTLGICHDQMMRYKEQAEFLGSKRYTDHSVRDFLNQVFPSMDKENDYELSRNAENAYEILETQPGANFAKGSWWSAFNAVTYLTDHKMGRSTSTRLQSAWYGQNRIRKEKAMELAVEFAEAA